VNEFHPILNNHKLKYDYEGYRSINLTGDWRIVFRKIDDNSVLLYRVGTHHQLFGK
jgi:addiction module RelE/StbE family toxin